jgi:hypothetical protein
MRRYTKPRSTLSLCILAIVSACAAQLLSQSALPRHSEQAKSLPWYVTAAAIHRVTLKPTNEFWKFEHLSLDPAESQGQLNAWKSEGIDALEIFAPEEGGNSYDGLDAKDRYKLDPGLGDISKFRALVATAHKIGMHVVTFQNLGYSALDAPQFQKAEQDVRAGRQSRESKFFFWSDRADAPPPAQGNSYFLVRPNQPGYDASKTEFWQKSETAGQFYWTRWPGKDEHGATTHLPHYNWVSPEWPAEARKVVSFWMSTGLDGMVVDAVNWYTGYDWKKNSELLATFHAFPGHMLLLPEGGGAFHTDDPVGWIKDGAWSALYDYGLDIWWEKQSRPMQQSIETGDPAFFENALRSYHDRVVAAGGVLIQPVLDMHDPGKQSFEEALLATSGDMLCYCESGAIKHPAQEIPELLKLKSLHPALYQNSQRRRIETDHDQSVYAALRYAADNSERVLLVFNFSAQPVDAAVDAGAVAGSAFRDLESGQIQRAERSKLHLHLDGRGHQIFAIEQSPFRDRERK